MEARRNNLGLDQVLERSAVAREEARRSKARSLASESEAEGPEPSDKMVDELVDELEEGELPPTLQEAPALIERKSYHCSVLDDG